MATIKINGKEFELKFNIKLDLDLNKAIKVEDEEKVSHKITGGFSKVINDLIDQNVGVLAKVFEVAAKGNKDFKNVTIDEILEAIEERMEEDGDADKLFKEVFEAIDRSAFTRNELKKFVNDMKLVRFMRSKEVSEDAALAMLNRLNSNYKSLTEKDLFDQETLTAIRKPIED